jgi:hypothetical protein
MPDPQKVLTTVRRATELFRSTPGRRGSLITLDESVDEVLVVGDLHGNIPAFRQVLLAADLANRPSRHLVLQELVHGNKYYPDDQGDKSHQLVDIVSALKCQFPDRVHLILGNHELSEITNRPIAKRGQALNVLFRQGIDTAYGSSGGAIYDAYLALFAALPLAVRTANRVFLCHTIPDPLDLEQFDTTIFDAETWPAQAMARHGAVYAITWGRNTEPENVDEFARLVDADWFITGHQPCDEGFRQANHRQIIIDATEPYPAYCLFPARGDATVESLLKCVRVFSPA